MPTQQALTPNPLYQGGGGAVYVGGGSNSSSTDDGPQDAKPIAHNHRAIANDMYEDPVRKKKYNLKQLRPVRSRANNTG